MPIVKANSLLTISQAAQADEQDKLQLLRDEWRAEDAVVFGVIRRGDRVWFLTQIHNRFGDPLEYPLDDLDPKLSLTNSGAIVPLGRNDRSDLVQIEGQPVRARFTLARPGSRAEVDNPLAIIIDHVSPEVELPKSMLSQSQNGFTLSKSLYDAIIEGKNPELAKAHEELKKKKTELEAAVVTAREDAAKHIEEVKNRAEEEISAIRSSTAEKNEELSALEARRADLTSQIDGLQENQNELAKNAAVYYRVGLIARDEYRRICGVPTTASNTAAFDRTVPGRVQRFLARECKLLYPRYLLDEFLALLFTHDLILLTGNSGTGKTSLVRGTAEALGGKAHIIPVKPNWISSEDLIGFLHPTSSRFHSGPLLDAFDEADDDSTRLHFICLDEMNLARIEHYFNDFISEMENRKDPQISLYSKVIAEELDDAALLNAKSGGSQRAPRPRPRRAIPSNVRFVGCLNVDDTTQPLSPKLRDRAHVIRLTEGGPLLARRITGELEAGSQSDPIELDASSFPERGQYPDFDDNSPVCKALAGWSREYLTALGVPVSARVMRQAQLYDKQFGSVTGLSSGSRLCLNSILLHKILPRFTFEGNQRLVGTPTELGRWKEKLDPRDQERATKQHMLAAFAQDLRTSNPLQSPAEYLVPPPDAADEVDRLIRNAAIYDGLIDYWA